MEATSIPQPSQGTKEGPRHHRPRRGRGGLNGAALAFRPSSVTPDVPQTSTDSTTPSSQAAEHVQSTRGRGRGRGRGSSDKRLVNGRQFGGRLTQATPEVAEGSADVEANPADPLGSISQHHKQPKQPKRRFSKSQAPDIATRTHEDIENGVYECPICTSEVRRNSKVWSCHTCWTVFHLACIKKWSSNEGSTAAQANAQNGESTAPRQWRCPGCNLPKDETPKLYSCWCGKEIDPKPLPGLPPHSCGNTCGKDRARACPHQCTMICHSGPCPPCGHMGPTQVCFCGKHEVTKRCSETDYESGWSCGEICGELMPCGEHLCNRTCHQGLCGGCEVRMNARCYCGQIEKEIMCSDRGREMESTFVHLDGTGESVNEIWTGSFDCGGVCGRTYDCSIHACTRTCHTQSAASNHCPRSPDVASSCPCRKTPLSVLLDAPRKTCEDPIPQCDKRCGKVLNCDHECEQVCHSGECMPCDKMVDVRCRCGRTTSKLPCHRGTNEPPHCGRPCKSLLNCSRHQCEEICCPGERQATERQGMKRKQRPLGGVSRVFDDGFEAEHICTQQCGRLLKCGTHFCPDLCHRGPCSTCREAIFDELACKCGKTILQPPLPCGTQPPPCRYPCLRPRTCGHPQVAHNCHQDDEACPKCPYLLEKRCMCSRKMVKNQPCWLQDVRCGEICGKVLKCGAHRCQRSCHRPGECVDSDGKPCQQACGKMKKICGHPDQESTCHAPFPCKEDKPCQSKLVVTCECGEQKQEVRCGASKSSEGNLKRKLPCNDECARLERNRRLASALNIDQAAHVDGGDHIPYSTETLELYAENKTWAQTQEREFRVFAASSEEKRLRFKPMQSHQRAFIHALAEDYGLESESVDPEPHRHVLIWKTSRFVSAPAKTLADAIRIRHNQRMANVAANSSDTEGKNSKARTTPANLPYNGFVIAKPKFGLTVDDIRNVLDTTLHTSTALTFNIDFLPNEEVVIVADSESASGRELQQLLESAKPHLLMAMGQKGYGMMELCNIDSSLVVTSRESDNPSEGGWSKVAAKRAAPKTSLPAASVTAANNTFSVLGNNKVTFTKKKSERPKNEPVVDDWEAAEQLEEEKEEAQHAEAESHTNNPAELSHNSQTVETAFDTSEH